MLVDVLVISLVIGFVLRGRLRNLADIQVHALPLLLLAAVLQIGTQWLTDLGWTQVAARAPLINIASFLLLLAVIWRNRHSPAILLTGLGIILNGLVIAANGGKMPVDPAAAAQAGLLPLEGAVVETLAIHQPLTETTRLAFLADVIPLARPYPRPQVLSIGDIVLAAGILWLIVGGMLGHRSVVGRRRMFSRRY